MLRCLYFVYVAFDDFSREELAKFEHRFSEGYDIKSDSRYNSWLSRLNYSHYIATLVSYCFVLELKTTVQSSDGVASSISQLAPTPSPTPKSGKATLVTYCFVLELVTSVQGSDSVASSISQLTPTSSPTPKSGKVVTSLVPLGINCRVCWFVLKQVPHCVKEAFAVTPGHTTGYSVKFVASIFIVSV